MAPSSFVFFYAYENTKKQCPFITLMNQFSGSNRATTHILIFINYIINDIHT